MRDDLDWRRNGLNHSKNKGLIKSTRSRLRSTLDPFLSPTGLGITPIRAKLGQEKNPRRGERVEAGEGRRSGGQGSKPEVVLGFGQDGHGFGNGAEHGY